VAGYFLAALSGLRLAASFPGLSCSLLSFVALVPLAHAIFLRPKDDAFRLGFVWGLVFFGMLLWWIGPTISRYGRLPMAVSWLVFSALVCYLALFPALWSFLFKRLIDAGDVSLLVVTASSSLWVLTEVLRSRLLSGFPWGSICYTLCSAPLLIQSADIWGPYGISFTVVFTNIFLWQIVRPFLTGPIGGYSRSDFRRVIMTGGAYSILCLFVMIYGRSALAKASPGNIRIAAVQGAIDQSLKWEPSYRAATIKTYETLTSSAKEKFPKTRLAVWPETAMPFYFQDDSGSRQQVLELAKRLKISILLGSPSYSYGKNGGIAYENSAFLIGSDGRIHGRYDKQHLVPFGEYMPWGILTSWARAFLPTAGEFVPGIDASPLVVDDYRLGVLICFESIFPEISRREVALGANILTVITNDAWFGRTSAPWQHADMAVFRAIETRRWVIRAANTGISRIISPTGRIVKQSGLFARGYLSADIGIADRETLYVRYGPYWFFCLNALIFLFVFLKRRQCRKGDSYE